MQNTPHSHYMRLLEYCEIAADPAQKAAVEVLQGVYHRLITPRDGGFFSRLLHKEKPQEERQGAYLWGGVGRGKSFLMDLFFASLPPSIPAKRVHFHAFMAQIHTRLHTLRGQTTPDPVEQIAKEIAISVKVLCFDELQVHDITDAMILGKLFSALFRLGVVMVMTSNRHPDDLYLHGLQREHFLPCIALLKSTLHIVELNGEQDYRKRNIHSLADVYLVGCSAEHEAQMQHYFSMLTHNMNIYEQKIENKGRTIVVNHSCRDVAWFTFDQLCAQPLGAEDYLVLARVFRIFFICNIPVMSSEKRNEAKRFVNLIDVLYENKCTLICSAQAAPDVLYPRGDGSFEFERTVSRLMEMQTDAYLEASQARRSGVGSTIQGDEYD